MRLLCLVLVAGLLAVTFAQDPERPFEFPIGGESIVMGELITIKWDPDWRDDKVLLFTATKVLLNLFITGTPGGEPTLKIPITEGQCNPCCTPKIFLRHAYEGLRLYRSYAE